MAVGEELVAVLHHLVRAHDQVVVVLHEELAHHVSAKGIRYAAIILRPARNVRLRIGPQQVAQQPCEHRRHIVCAKKSARAKVARAHAFVRIKASHWPHLRLARQLAA